MITDYPRTLSKEHATAIENIVRKGRKAGVFVVLGLDTDYESDDRYSPINPMRVLDEMTVAYEKGGQWYLKNIPGENYFRRFRLSLDNSLLRMHPQLMDFIENQRALRSSNSSVDLVDHLPKEGDWWIRSATQGLNIPFGVNAEGNPIDLTITQTQGQNTGIVVGIPGSGKSVFLKTIIASASVHYSPREMELYLIDFSGVEFSVFRDLPHVRVLAPESEREFGISVLRRIKDEGVRRADLFREKEVNDFTSFRREHPEEPMPRLMVIIDEFQKLFEHETDIISSEAESILHIIVKEYRKFGINLLLATQSIGQYRSRIEMNMIANRVCFEWSESDTMVLFQGQPPFDMVTGTGDCVYNNRSGSPAFNVPAHGYFAKTEQLSALVSQLNALGRKREEHVDSPIVFLSKSTVSLSDNRDLSSIERSSLPSKVRMYLGEPIEICPSHAYIELSVVPNANVVIVGGSNGNASTRIAINSVRSLAAYYADQMAYFYVFNYLPSDNPLREKPAELYGMLPFDVAFPTQSDQLETLEKINGEIERRQQDPQIKRRSIFLLFIAFEHAYSFPSRGFDPSPEGAALMSILEKGPLVGVHCILQVDNLKSLANTFDRPLDMFGHRVVLQMSENDSRRITDTAIASTIYTVGQESSKNRAYYYDVSNNSFIKFKPYEI